MVDAVSLYGWPYIGRVCFLNAATEYGRHLKSTLVSCLVEVEVEVEVSSAALCFSSFFCVWYGGKVGSKLRGKGVGRKGPRAWDI